MISGFSSPPLEALLRDARSYCRESMPTVRPQTERQVVHHLAVRQEAAAGSDEAIAAGALALQALDNLGNLDLTTALDQFGTLGRPDPTVVTRGAWYKLVACGLSQPMLENWGVALLRLIALGQAAAVRPLMRAALAHLPPGTSHQLAYGLLGGPVPDETPYDVILAAVRGGEGLAALVRLADLRVPQGNGKLDLAVAWDRLAVARVTGMRPESCPDLWAALLDVSPPEKIEAPLIRTVVAALAPDTPWADGAALRWGNSLLPVQRHDPPEWEGRSSFTSEAQMRNRAQQKLKKRAMLVADQERRLLDSLARDFPEDDGTEDAVEEAAFFSNGLLDDVQDVAATRWLRSVVEAGRTEVLDRAALLSSLLIEHSLMERIISYVADLMGEERRAVIAAHLPPVPLLQRVAALGCMLDPWMIAPHLRDVRILVREVHLTGMGPQEYRWLSNATLALMDLWENTQPDYPDPYLTENRSDDAALSAGEPLTSVSYSALIKALEWRNMGEFVRWLPRAHYWRRRRMENARAFGVDGLPVFRLVPWELILAVKIMEERSGKRVPETGDVWLDKWVMRLRPYFHEEAPIMDPLASAWLELADWIGDLPAESPILDLVIPLMRAANAR